MSQKAIISVVNKVHLKMTITKSDFDKSYSSNLIFLKEINFQND